MFPPQLVRALTEFVTDMEQRQARFDVSPVHFRDVSVVSLNAYVLGDFHYYMCWFVRLASAHDDYLAYPFDADARAHTRKYVLNELSDMLNTTRGS